MSPHRMLHIRDGEAFEIWTSNTNTYYAWGDPDDVMEVLLQRRQRSARTRDSSISEFDAKWIQNPKTLPCLHPRIAFRDITKRTNRRTVIACLVPPNVFLTNVATYLLSPRGDEKDQAFLLGVLCSIPVDWHSRRFGEGHVTC